MGGKSKYYIDDAGRECTKCGEYKEWDAFVKQGRGINSRSSICKKCSAKWHENRRRSMGAKAQKDCQFDGVSKICFGCGIRKPLEEYYLNSTSVGGRESKCIECKRALDNIKRNGTPNPIRKKWKITKTGRECTKCGEFKTWDFYYIDSSRRNGYSNSCKECHISYMNTKSVEGKVLASVFLPKLTIDDRASADSNDFLIVKCTYCGKEFMPSYSEVRRRVNCINGTGSGEARLYCSENCKAECPIFWKRSWPEGTKSTSRFETVNSFIRQEVFKRDNYTCQKCGKSAETEKIALHCHHITPKAISPMEVNDVDNLITLCKRCHIQVHTEIDGCGYADIIKCQAE